MATLPPYPRKRLGQHFLIDPNLLRKIVSLADLKSSDFVCEIGPGGGALTGLLCQSAKQVLALEVDPRMVDFLRTELAGHANLEVQEQDALHYSFDRMPEPTVVVANLPYNISTPLLFRLLEAGGENRAHGPDLAIGSCSTVNSPTKYKELRSVIGHGATLSGCPVWILCFPEMFPACSGCGFRGSTAG